MLFTNCTICMRHKIYGNKDKNEPFNKYKQKNFKNFMWKGKKQVNF